MARPRRASIATCLFVAVAWLSIVTALTAYRAAPPPPPASQAQEAPLPTTQPTSPEFQAAVREAAEAAQLAAREQLMSGLIGSKHDFRSADAEGRDLCLACHTPHLVGAPTPLLDRRPATTPPLRPYQTIEIELNNWSLLCLGCHDGVTAPDVYSSAHAVQVTDQLAGTRLDMRSVRSHPVGIRYPVASPDYNPVLAVEGAGLRLPEGRIQCTTCHDAHNTYGHKGMLRIADTRSQLCLTCHRR